MAARKWTGLFDPIEAPRAPRSATPDTLDDEALFAYYRRTAPLEDTRFMLLNAELSLELRKEFEWLFDELQMGRVADFRARYVVLQDRWRVEANRRHPYVSHESNYGKESPCSSTCSGGSPATGAGTSSDASEADDDAATGEDDAREARAG